MSAFPATLSLSPTGRSLVSDDFEEEQGVYLSGAPLTRMIDWECLSVSSFDNNDDDEEEEEEEEECCWENHCYENINVVDDGFSLSDYLLNAIEGGEPDDEDGHSYTPIPQHHLQQAIEDIPYHADDSTIPRWLLQSTVSTSSPRRKILFRHLPSISRSSRELSIWRFLNQPHLRRDPWNPAPPTISIIEREVGLSASARFARLVEFGLDEDHKQELEAFIAMERLYPVHDNPLETRSDWIDFIRQMLQSLVFLHEHSIAQVKFNLSDDNLNSPAIMMDIGLAPAHTTFSRAEYPVKYYLVDYSEAIRLEIQEHQRRREPVRRGRSRHIVRLSASRPERFNRRTSHDCGAPYLQEEEKGQILFPTPDHINSHLSPYKEIRKRNSVSSRAVRVVAATNHLLDDLSDPEADSGSEAFSSDDDDGDGKRDSDDSLRRVPSSIRSLAFGLDLQNLAEMLEKALPSSMNLIEPLAPLFDSIRQGNSHAKAILDDFESSVRFF